VLAGALALPVAGVLWRGNVRPSPFLELCGFLPLFVPPFVLSDCLAQSWIQHPLKIKVLCDGLCRIRP
jgi:ABC-type Fe3+ transport system permease subunit